MSAKNTPPAPTEETAPVVADGPAFVSEGLKNDVAQYGVGIDPATGRLVVADGDRLVFKQD